jgi:digeranylgeranylglycerophospholipid reductase
MFLKTIGSVKMDDYDVVIIGAGPAGSSTAFYAARKGLRVLIVDQRKMIGDPVQCGEFIPTTKELEIIFPRAKNLSELFSINYSLIEMRTNKIKCISPKMKEYEIPFEGYTVDRRIYDKYLVKKAIEAGADLRTNTKFLSLNCKRVKLDKGQIETKVIVGADGYASNVAKSIRMKTVDLLCPCILGQVEGEFEPIVEMFFGSIAPGGYAWVIPKNNSANVGLGIQKTSNIPLRNMLNKFLKLRKLKDICKLCMGFVPISGPIPQTVKNNVIIVGDAAGQVMATSGGGIPISMICGRLAGNAISEHIKNNVPLELYEKQWKYVVGSELKTALEIKKMFDKVFRRNFTLEFVMKIMGSKRMGRAIKCKSIFNK